MTNAKTVLESIEREIDELVIDLRSGGWRVIGTGIAIGERLIRGEGCIPARQLGRWEKAKWGWSKNKTARLRRLARHADIIIAEYNKGTASMLPDPLTITGVDTWAQKKTGDFKARTKTSKAGATGNTSDTDGAVDTVNDIANLRRELREALNRIKELEERLAHRVNDPKTEIGDVEAIIAKTDEQAGGAAFQIKQDTMAEIEESGSLDENKITVPAVPAKRPLSKHSIEVRSQMARRLFGKKYGFGLKQSSHPPLDDGGGNHGNSSQ